MFVLFFFVDFKDFWRETDAIHHTSKFHFEVVKKLMYHFEKICEDKFKREKTIEKCQLVQKILKFKIRQFFKNSNKMTFISFEPNDLFQYFFAQLNLSRRVLSKSGIRIESGIRIVKTSNCNFDEWRHFHVKNP